MFLIKFYNHNLVENTTNFYFNKKKKIKKIVLISIYFLKRYTYYYLFLNLISISKTYYNILNIYKFSFLIILFIIIIVLY